MDANQGPAAARDNDPVVDQVSYVSRNEETWRNADNLLFDSRSHAQQNKAQPLPEPDGPTATSSGVASNTNTRGSLPGNKQEYVSLSDKSWLTDFNDWYKTRHGHKDPPQITITPASQQASEISSDEEDRFIDTQYDLFTNSCSSVETTRSQTDQTASMTLQIPDSDDLDAMHNQNLQILIDLADPNTLNTSSDDLPNIRPLPQRARAPPRQTQEASHGGSQ